MKEFISSRYAAQEMLVEILQTKEKEKWCNLETWVNNKSIGEAKNGDNFIRLIWSQQQLFKA